MAEKLTAPMKNALTLLARGPFKDNFGNAALQALRRQGLAKMDPTKGSARFPMWEITDAGRTALKGGE